MSLEYTSSVIVGKCLNGVKKSWKNVILRDPDCRKYFSDSLKELQKRYQDNKTFFDKLQPPLENVLDAFKKFEFDELKSVIVRKEYSIKHEAKIPDNGVLILNRYLTTTKDSNEQHIFWDKFTKSITRYISNNTKGVIVTHGRPTQEKSNIEPTNTEPTNTEYIAYTDGSAVGNGKANCNAGCAYVLLSKDDAGYTIVHEYKEDIKKLTTDTPTNNIAELFGVVKLIEYILDNNNKFSNMNINVYCDNKYVIDNYVSRVEKWIKAGTLNQMKNPDLNNRLIELKNKLKNNNIELKMNHVYSHRKEPAKGTDEWDRWYYNDKVDKLAKSAY